MITTDKLSSHSQLFRFKVSLPFEPYLYLLVAKENIQEVTAFLSKKYGQYILKITQVFHD